MTLTNGGVSLDIIHSGEAFEIKSDVKMPTQKTCERCGYMSSNDICKACVLLEGLNRGLPQLGIGKGSRMVRVRYCVFLVIAYRQFF